jgi:hypothetical protein
MPETIPTPGYGKVVGRFMAIVGDSAADADDLPDGMPLTGEVVFTPVVDSILVPGANPPITVIPQAVTAVLDEQGYLSAQGTRGIKLMASVNPSAVPSQFPYMVSFDKLRYDGAIVKYAAFRFNVPADGVVDLTTVAPVTNTGAVVNVVNQAALDQAVAAAEVRIVTALSGAAVVDATARSAAAEAQADADDAFLLANTAKTAATNADAKATTATAATTTLTQGVNDARFVADNAYRIADAITTRFGVKALDVSQQDLDTITQSGQYRGYQIINGPAQFPTGWWYIEVIQHDADWILQRITGFTDAQQGRTFQRQKNAGAWRAWVETGTYIKPYNGIPETDLTSEVAAKLNKATGTNVLVLASSTSTVPGGTAPNTLVITPVAA